MQYNLKAIKTQDKKESHNEKEDVLWVYSNYPGIGGHPRDDLPENGCCRVLQREGR
jgi:hypothetical protein